MRAWKTFSVLLPSFILAFALSAWSYAGNDEGAGIAGAPPPSASPVELAIEPAEPIELTFWTLGSNGYERLVEEWNAANPNIQVTIRNSIDKTDHHRQLLDALTAGSGAPDLFQLEIAFVETFMEHQDRFRNLHDYGAAGLKSQYLDWKWEQASSVDGSFLIGLPTDVGPTAVIYRADLAEAAGLPTIPERFSWELNTWEEFAQVAKEYTSRTGKPFTDNADMVFNALRDQSEGQIYIDKHDGHLLVPDENPQIKKAYDFAVQGIKEGWISGTPFGSPEWFRDMNDGGFVVTLSPAWMISAMKDKAPDSAGAWRVAQMPEGSGNWGGSFIALPKEGRHPEEAFEFARWLTSKEKQLQSFLDDGLFPSIPSLYEDPVVVDYMDEFFGGQQIGVAFGQAAQTISPMYYGSLHDQVDAIFKQALRNVIDGGADAAKEWAAAVEQAEELVSRQGRK